MSDTAPATAAAPTAAAAPLSAVHTAIRRGSVLKAAPPPAAAAAAAERARMEYLREANEEAEALSNNAALLHTLHRQASVEGIPPPPPPPAEDQSDDAIPPPPPAPAAALLEDLTNPLLRVSLAPVNPGALRLNDGLNAVQATLLAITSSARGPPQSKLRPVAVGPSGGLSAGFVDSYLAEEAELEASLSANRGLADALLTSGPPPAFPESDADLAEAQEAKRQEEEALVKLPAPADDDAVAASAAAVSSSGSTDKVVRARRNSKLLLHAELTKPLARLALNPTITEERDIKTIVKQQQEAEKAAAEAEAAAAAAGPAAQ